VARLSRLLLTGLLVALLLAVAACGDQTDTEQAATPGATEASQPADPADEADRLMAEVKELAKSTNDLMGTLWEGQMFEVVLATSAAAAKPELAKARKMEDEIAANEKSIAALLDRVAKLGVSEELTTYAGQQKEIAELLLLGVAKENDLLDKIETAYREKGKVSQAELEKLFTEPSDPDDPLMHIEEKGLASIKYFKKSGLPERYSINNGFGEMFGQEETSEGIPEGETIPEEEVPAE
jgi:hypothetical protein